MTEAQLNSLYRYALALCGNSDQAYDLLQQVISNALKSENTRDISQLKDAFWRRCIRNVFIDQWRHESQFQTEPFDETVVSLSQEAELEQQLINEQQVEALLTQLKPAEREVLYLWAVEEMTAAEIATAIESTRGTVLSRLHRIKCKLRRVDDTTQQEARP